MPGDCPVAPDPDTTVTAQIECGHVLVPMDPADPSNGVVRLAFLRVRAEGATTRPPLLMLAGGPGTTMQQSPTYGFFSLGFLGPILKDRDVLILDERGSHYSDPVLDCPGFDRIAWTANQSGATADAEIALAANTLAACARDATARGIDLTLFNSRAMAADIEAARIAFGYDRFLVYGASYGTILAQHYLRDFPRSVEALILDGANPLATKSWVEDRARDFAFAFANIAALCESDPDCGAAYDLAALADAGLAAFADGPLSVPYVPDDDDVPPLTVALAAEDFAAFVYNTMNGQINVRSLPYLLAVLTANGAASMSEGLGPEIGAQIVAARDAGRGGLLPLMHYVVTCSEDPARSVEEVQLSPDMPEVARLFGLQVGREYVAFCAALDLPELPPETDIDDLTDLPVLLLAGRLDSRTPAYYAERLAKELPQATLAEFPEGTHVQLGEINTCAAGIVVAFAAEPSRKPDTGCIAAIPARGFMLPDGTMSQAPVPLATRSTSRKPNG